MGSVVISVEVGPGSGHDPDEESDERHREMLPAWRRASYLFDRYEVPATWLVAGHLFAPASRVDSPDIQDGTPATRRADEGERAGSPNDTSDGVSSSEARRGSSEQSSDGVAPNEERRGSSEGNSDGVSSSEARRGSSEQSSDGVAPNEERCGSSEGTSGGGPASDRKGASQGSGDEPNASPVVHPDHPEEASQFPGDSAADRDRPVRSVPDMIEGLCRSRVAHEIGCLPFSRTDFCGASQDDAAGEVRASIDAAAELGVGTEQLRAFAFPDGRVGHRDVLAAYGFECYREPGSGSNGPISSLRVLLGLVARRLTGTGPALVEPETDEHGLVAVPTSASLFPLDGRARAAARAGRGDPVADLAKRGIDRATESDGVLHLSFAPTDLGSGADFERLETVLSHVAECREETDLAVETLGQVARRLGDRAATMPTPVR